MEATEIIEGNILIDTFLTGRELMPLGHEMGRIRGSGPKHYNYYDRFFVDMLEYHKSWDWLIPVYIKFRELPYKSDKHTAHMNLITQALIHGRIDWLWNELTIAIKWYNETQKQ